MKMVHIMVFFSQFLNMNKLEAPAEVNNLKKENRRNRFEDEF